MPIFSTLTFATLRTKSAPLITTMVQAVYQGPNGKAALAPFNPNTIQRQGLRPFAGTSRPGDVPGKVSSYRLGSNTDMHLVLTITRTSKGKAKKRTMMFACSAREQQGDVKMRYGGGLITLLAGPLRRVREDEAVRLMGAMYNTDLEYKDGDFPVFGVQLSGMTETVAPQSVQTVGEHGEDRTVFVKRAPRRIGV